MENGENGARDGRGCGANGGPDLISGGYPELSGRRCVWGKRFFIFTPSFKNVRRSSSFFFLFTLNLELLRRLLTVVSPPRRQDEDVASLQTRTPLRQRESRKYCWQRLPDILIIVLVNSGSDRCVLFSLGACFSYLFLELGSFDGPVKAWSQ